MLPATLPLIPVWATTGAVPSTAVTVSSRLAPLTLAVELAEVKVSVLPETEAVMP